MDVSARLDAAIAESDAVAVDRILFDAGRGEFVFSIRSSADSEIDLFRERLGRNGLAASDSSGYRRAGDVWVGEMKARLK